VAKSRQAWLLTAPSVICTPRHTRSLISVPKMKQICNCNYILFTYALKNDPMTTPWHAYTEPEGRRRCSSNSFATWREKEVGGQHQAPDALPSGKDPVTGGWVGLGASLCWLSWSTYAASKKLYIIIHHTDTTTPQRNVYIVTIWLFTLRQLCTKLADLVSCCITLVWFPVMVPSGRKHVGTFSVVRWTSNEHVCTFCWFSVVN